MMLTGSAIGVARPLEPFTPSAPEAVVVVPDSIHQDAMTTDYREAFDGKVTAVQPDVENGTLVVIGKHRLRVALPANITLPIHVGETLKVELWSTAVARHELGLNGIHAAITDANGAPVVFVNDAPAGWSFEVGAPKALPRRSPVLEDHAVNLRAAELTATVFGWVQGRVAGADYVVYASATVVAPVAAQQQPKSDVPAWSSVVNSSIVRVRPAPTVQHAPH